MSILAEAAKAIIVHAVGYGASQVYGDQRDYETKEFICPNWGTEHPLSLLFKETLEPWSPEAEKRAIHIFKRLPPSLQEHIVAANEEDPKDTKQLQWQHLNEAIKTVVCEILDRKPKGIYGPIYALAGRPATSDWDWGKTHAKEDILRLITVLNAHHRLETNTPPPSFEIQVCSAMENNMLERAQTYLLSEGRTPVHKGKIGYINGMNFTRREAENDAGTLSWHCADNHQLECVYSPTHGKLNDRLNLLVQASGSVLTPTVGVLIQNWVNFFYSHPTEKYLQIAYSRGGLEIYNALSYLPPEWRERIIVIAIAPGCSIPGELAHRVFNLWVDGDSVKSYAYKGVSILSEEAPEDITLKVDHSNESKNLHSPNHPNMRAVVSRLVREYLETNTCSEPLAIKREYGVPSVPTEGNNLALHVGVGVLAFLAQKAVL